MPTYAYACAACGHEFDLYQGMSDKPVRKCPACGKAKAQRQVSGGAGFVFKGSGFYETDYKRGEGSEYKKKADADTKPAAKEVEKTSGKEGEKSGGKEGAKTESKEGDRATGKEKDKTGEQKPVAKEIQEKKPAAKKQEPKARV